jgi:hypothetical protein
MKSKMVSIISTLSFLVISIASSVAPIPAHAATWQETLEQAFPGAVVETFDNLQDWQPPIEGRISDPSALPKQLDGSSSHWTCYDGPGLSGFLRGESGIKAISNHGEYSLGQLGAKGQGKSLLMRYSTWISYNALHPELAAYDRQGAYGPARMSMFLGTPGDPTSGLKEYYLFYRLKFRRDTFSLTGGNYTWTKSAHGTDEYYLDMGSEPGLFNPNALTINSVRTMHAKIWPHFLDSSAVDRGNGNVGLYVTEASKEYPGYQNGYPGFWGHDYAVGDQVVISGTAHYDGVYTIQAVDLANGWVDIAHAYMAETFNHTPTMSIVPGSLGPDQWSFGDNDNLGYYTIYVRLSGASSADRDPKNKPANYITYENGFFARVPLGYTLLRTKSGQYNDGSGTCNKTWCYYGWPKHLMLASGFYDAGHWLTASGSGCAPNIQTDYGANFFIFNFGGNEYYNTNNRMVQGVAHAVWNSQNNCYDYSNQDFGWGNTSRDIRESDNVPLTQMYENKQWVTVELHIKVADPDQSNGTTELWLYDEAGNIISHASFTGDNSMALLGHKTNKIEFGGNNIFSSYFSATANDQSWDTRWYLDDVIVANRRIGPTYFSLVKADSPPVYPLNLRIR